MKTYTNKKIILDNGQTMQLNDYIKETATFLIDELQVYKDKFSNEFRRVLKSTLGKDWGIIIEKFEKN